MVSKVLEWKKAKAEEAHTLWQELGSKNDRVTELFTLLEAEHHSSPQAYSKIIALCAEAPASKVRSSNSSWCVCPF